MAYPFVTQVINDQPHLTVHWQKTSNCVVMHWHRFCQNADFRNGLDLGLDTLIAKRSSRWLADLRDLGPVTVEDKEWTNTVWFPRALASSLRYMALVVPQNVVAGMSVDEIMNKVANTALVTHHFSDVTRAWQWLTEQP